MQKALLSKKIIYAIDIDTWNEEEIRNSGKIDELICPYCNEPLILKLGTAKISHFAHKKANTDCFYSQISNAEYNLVEEAQVDFLSTLRTLYPDVSFDIAVRDYSSIIDVCGDNIKIKFISKYNPNVSHKDKSLLHIYLCNGYPVMPGLSSMMTDTLLYDVSKKHLILYKVKALPYTISTTTVEISNLIITKDNIVDYSNFTSEKIVFDQEVFDSIQDKILTSSKNTNNSYVKPKYKNKSTEVQPPFVRKPDNELYPNLYLYLLDIKNGIISLGEAENKLSYYLGLLYIDKKVWFKYNKNLKADEFTGSDFYCVIKRKLREMKAESIKFQELFNKLVG